MPGVRRSLLAACGSILVLASTTVAAPKQSKTDAKTSKTEPIVIEVDARDAPQNIFHSRLVIPAKPGPFTLVYPKWIPGEHGPTGPINEMAGLHFQVDGKPLPWRRDDVDMYAFHCTVPKGASAVEAKFDLLTPADVTRFSGPAATEALAVLCWNQVLLYPQGSKSSEVPFKARLQLPEGWKYGTALPVATSDKNHIEFETVSLETLVDSPVLSGKNFRVVPLTGGDPPDIEIDMACDSEAGLAMSPELVANYQRLVAEADALFGARHFRRYHFLLTLSDHMAGGGLEHHESSDNRVAERSLIDKELTVRMAGLLPHEFGHSWCGKYRRPAGIATVDYQQPMQGELLWVYEGLTTYFGFLLPARSGLRSKEITYDLLADVAAYLDQRPGRTWRPLRDTAVAAQLVYVAPEAGEEARRAADFYNEGLLIWLDADVLIRQQTQGAKSLDDFCRSFFGGEGGVPRVVPYTFDDIVTTLNAVAPYDWREFLNTRLDSTSPHAPLGGIVNGGWQLAFGDSVPRLQKMLEEANKNTDLRYSVGFKVRENGTISDVVPGRAAAHANVTAGSKLVAVDGRRWTPKVLREAIRAAKTSNEPLTLLVQEGEFFVTRQLDYKDGERYPRLQRDPAKPDLITPILSQQVGGIASRAKSE